MYFLHLFLSTVPQNSIIHRINSSFVFGLTLRQIYSFSSCHKFSIGFRSDDSAGVFHQFTPLLLNLSAACIPWGMFWAVFLHELVTTRIDFFNKWQQCSIKDLHEQLLQYAFKRTDSSPSMFTDTSPYMYLGWMFGSKQVKTIHKTQKVESHTSTAGVPGPR